MAAMYRARHSVVTNIQEDSLTSSATAPASARSTKPLATMKMSITG